MYSGTSNSEVPKENLKSSKKVLVDILQNKCSVLSHGLHHIYVEFSRRSANLS